MAITNAQQYQQLVNKPANGKRPGYRGDYSYGNPSGAGYDPGEGQASEGSGISEGSGGFAPTSQAAINTGGYQAPTFTGGATSYQGVNVSQEAKDKAAKDKKEAEEKAAADKKKKKENTRNFFQKFIDKRKKAYLQGIEKRMYEDDMSLEDYEEEDFEKGFAGNYGKIQGAIKSAGEGTLTQSEFEKFMPGGIYSDKPAPIISSGGGGGGNQQQTDPCKGPNPPAYCNVGDDDDDDTTTPDRNLGGLAPRFAGSIFDFTGLADGGIARAGAMDGGRMMKMMANEEEDTPEGGIMDLESGRQMYFLGKLVKKATRAVKKVAKSPIGKAALLYGLGAMGGSFGAGKGFFSKGMFNLGNMKRGLLGANSLMMNKAGLGSQAAMKGLFGKLGLTSGYGGLMPTLKGGITLGLGIPTLMDLFGKKEEDDDSAYKKYMEDMKINMGARDKPFDFLPSYLTGYGKADGGRIGYQEGGDAEPVAKETMPLIDMDGKEMDLREDGGFVPLGRMERADDVPARLSKNEFVFTADAVRNAGEGDIDKGAEVMYNMMKNLESGGEVSEESQGLDGAREMFKTSQRLEEVL